MLQAEVVTTLEMIVPDIAEASSAGAASSTAKATGHGAKAQPPLPSDPPPGVRSKDKATVHGANAQPPLAPQRNGSVLRTLRCMPHGFGDARRHIGPKPCGAHFDIRAVLATIVAIPP